MMTQRKQDPRPAATGIEFPPAGSEFDEAYEDEPSQVRETFRAELIEQTLEVLRRKEPICVAPSTLVSDAVRGMAERNQGCVLVKDNDRLVGIFTERDVLRKVVGKVDPAKTRVEEVMTPEPEAVFFHDTIAAAMNKMTIGGFRHVPLVDIAHRPVGVVSVKDIVEYVVDHFPYRVLNVAPNPDLRDPDSSAGAG